MKCACYHQEQKPTDLPLFQEHVENQSLLHSYSSDFLVFSPLKSYPPPPRLHPQDCQKKTSAHANVKILDICVWEKLAGDGITLYRLICFISARHWHYNDQFVGFVVSSLHVILLILLKEQLVCTHEINLPALKHFYSSFKPFYSNVTDGQLIQPA